MATTKTSSGQNKPRPQKPARGKTNLTAARPKAVPQRSRTKKLATHRSSSSERREFRSLRERLKITRSLLADMAGVSERTLASWESGAEVKKLVARAIDQIHRLLKALAGVMKPEFVLTWLQQPNELCGALSPLELLRRNEPERVWRAVYFLESGTPI